MERAPKPIRFAGTCRRYSKRAMPQETRAATHQARARRWARWPYQATVMNRLEATSRVAATSAGWRRAAVLGSSIGDQLSRCGRLATHPQRFIPRILAPVRGSPGAALTRHVEERLAFTVGPRELRMRPRRKS